jgi:hypothetical protein
MLLDHFKLQFLILITVNALMGFILLVVVVLLAVQL